MRLKHYKLCCRTVGVELLKSFEALLQRKRMGFQLSLGWQEKETVKEIGPG